MRRLARNASGFASFVVPAVCRMWPTRAPPLHARVPASATPAFFLTAAARSCSTTSSSAAAPLLTDVLERIVCSRGGSAVAVKELVRMLPDDVLDELDCGLTDAIAWANHHAVTSWMAAADAKRPMPTLFVVTAGDVRLVRGAIKLEVVDVFARCAGVPGASEMELRSNMTDLAAAALRVTLDAAQPAVMRATTLASGAADTASTAVHVDEVPGCPGESSAKKKKKKNKNKARVEEDLTPATLPVSPELAACLPTFIVPLTVAAAAYRNAGVVPAPPESDAAPADAEAATTGSEPATATSTGAPTAPHASLDDVAAFRDAILLADDTAVLLGPWREPPSTVEAIASGLYEREYVSVLPPLSDLVREAVDDNFAPYRVAEHDHYRLARYLHTAFRVTVDSLERGPVAEVLTRPVLQVILSSPMFEYRPKGTSGEASYAAGIDGATRTERFFPTISQFANFNSSPDVLPSLSHVTPEYTDATRAGAQSESDELGTVRFVLAHPEWHATVGGVPNDVAQLCLDDLQQLAKLITKSRTDAHARHAAQVRFGLTKPLPGGAKLASFKHKVNRAMLRQELPDGSPFMDRNVLAYFMFDMLPPDSGVDVLAFRTEHLPRTGRTVFPISSSFIHAFPHLWQQRQGRTAQDWVIERIDSPNLPPPEDPDALTEEEIVDTILTQAPQGDRFDPHKKTSTSAVMTGLPEVMRKRIRSEGGICVLMKRHTEHFELLDDEFFLWRSLGGF